MKINNRSDQYVNYYKQMEETSKHYLKDGLGAIGLLEQSLQAKIEVLGKRITTQQRLNCT